MARITHRDREWVESLTLVHRCLINELKIESKQVRWSNLMRESTKDHQSMGMYTDTLHRSYSQFEECIFALMTVSCALVTLWLSRSSVSRNMTRDIV